MRIFLFPVSLFLVFGIQAITQTGTIHRDWLNLYQGGETRRQQDINAIQAADSTLQYNWIGYNFSRYMLHGWLEMYRVTGDTVYLGRIKSLADLLFTQGTGNRQFSAM